MTDITDRPQAELRGFPIRIRELTLLRRELVTPLMLRVTLGGPEHVGFESHIADEHIKLIFPDPETGELNVPTQNGDVIDWPRPLPPTRDYTVRRYDPGAGEVDIDVVVHTVGLASTWAQQAPIGSRIPVAGPPRGIHIPDEFTWQAYFGDETALPAIARRVAELPRSTRGYAVIEVQNAAEEQPLDAPEGVEVRWLHRADRPRQAPVRRHGVLAPRRRRRRDGAPRHRARAQAPLEDRPLTRPWWAGPGSQPRAAHQARRRSSAASGPRTPSSRRRSRRNR
ncbi:siderophore-interacting protein [Microbacterium sp. bgisy203]|uniref:siderophore-interacting protein n=1 Tax=Microbacterium sp. bgisy203 TaxID=3413799 RepID=UPI003D751E02